MSPPTRTICVAGDVSAEAVVRRRREPQGVSGQGAEHPAVDGATHEEMERHGA
jgi:hypothetical protein